MKTKIAIQGYKGSFHQIAAHQFFGKEVETIPCLTFKEVIDIASNGVLSDGGVMAIENSIAGSILPNYNLLHKSKLKIAGEVYLPIQQNLLAIPGVKLENIQEVHSHTMAIQQCYNFLSKYQWKLVETEDTALSAQLLSEHKIKNNAAIASKLAAEIFNLNVIAENINDTHNNYTRFLILKRDITDNSICDADKASLCFDIMDKTGCLSNILSKISSAGINLSKLQSFPIPGSNFKYSFYVDMEFEKVDVFLNMMDVIKPYTEDLRLYGIYKKGALNI